MLARLDAIVEAASATFLGALDDSENTTARLYLQKKQPGSRRSMAASNARTSRTQQFSMSNRRASFPSTMTKTPNPHLPSLEEDDSVHHSSKHNFPDCQTEPDCGAQKTACWPMERGNRWRGSRSCATRESHSSGFYHLDACGGTVLAPHNFIISVHKRLGNRSYAGFGECHLCGSLLDAQLEHGENCSTAEATQGHHACVKAILGGLRLAQP